MDLRSFRESRGLTLERVAEELGLNSKGYLSALETGSAAFGFKLALHFVALSCVEVRAVELLAADDAQLLRAAIERQPAEAAA